MRYDQTYDDDWLYPVMRGFRLRCCDCGLVHNFNFKIVKGRVWFQPSRANSATRAARRTKKYAGLALPTRLRKLNRKR